MEATRTIEKASLQQNLYAVENLKQPIWEGTAIKALNLLKAVHTVKIERHQYKKGFPETFTSLEKLEHVYQISLGAVTQAFSIANSRILPSPKTESPSRTTASEERWGHNPFCEIPNSGVS